MCAGGVDEDRQMWPGPAADQPGEAAAGGAQPDLQLLPSASPGQVSTSCQMSHHNNKKKTTKISTAIHWIQHVSVKPEDFVPVEKSPKSRTIEGLVRVFHQYRFKI